jgi:hypothetical protein
MTKETPNIKLHGHFNKTAVGKKDILTMNRNPDSEREDKY